MLLHGGQVENIALPFPFPIAFPKARVIMLCMKRNMTGVRNPNARLTPGDVLDIRHWAAQGTTQQALAEEFGITQAHVSDIVRRRKWAHLEEE